MTLLHEQLASGRERLVAAGIDPTAAAIDVDLFARTILGWDRARVLTARAEPAPEGLEPRFSEWILRRARREPAAYIVGIREFWGLDFRVTSDVLIPRPETEFIVEESLAILSTLKLTSPRLADIGTGSGCLAVSLAHEIAGRAHHGYRRLARRHSPSRATTRVDWRELASDVRRDVLPRRDRRPIRSDRGQSTLRQGRRQARAVARRSPRAGRRALRRRRRPAGR